MNNKLKLTITGFAGLVLAATTYSIYKAVKDSPSEENTEKRINVRHLKNKMGKYTYETKILCCYQDLPVWLVKCDMKKSNQGCGFLERRKI